MKKVIAEFMTRGLLVCGFGPVILAIIYGVLGKCGVLEHLSVEEVVLGILSITLMVFIAAGITCVYQFEKIPLFLAILFHGIALYVDYILLYTVNGWLREGLEPFLIFTIVFVVGYVIVWLIIYIITKKGTDRLNRCLVHGKN